MKRPVDYPHIPGVNARHAEGAFDAIRASAAVVTRSEGAPGNAAWACGVELFNEGFYWEAHEVWEEVWMRAPEASPEKAMTQAAIQLANAALKVRMAKPNATRRLCAIVEERAQAAGSGVVMGLDARAVIAAAQALAVDLDASGLRLEWAEGG